MNDDLSADAVSLARALMRLACVPGRIQVTVEVSPYPAPWMVEISRVERLQVLGEERRAKRAGQRARQ